MEKFKSYKEESKSNWGVHLPEEKKLNRGQLHLGAVLRIAEATEKMASNYTQMQNDLEMYKRWYYQEKVKTEKLTRSNNALRGVITKLKKKIL